MQKKGLDELADSLTAALQIVLNLPDYDAIETRKIDDFRDGADWYEWMQRAHHTSSNLEQMLRMVNGWQKWKKMNTKEESDGA